MEGFKDSGELCEYLKELEIIHSIMVENLLPLMEKDPECKWLATKATNSAVFNIAQEISDLIATLHKLH